MNATDILNQIISSSEDALLFHEKAMDFAPSIRLRKLTPPHS